MAPATTGGSSSVPSLPPPCPKSPPEYPDLYGKRREMAKVQMLEREIGFLEEELKSLHGLQPASRCCKEVTDFVVANSDPLIPTSRKKRRSCLFWKWLWYCFLVHFSCVSWYTLFKPIMDLLLLLFGMLSSSRMSELLGDAAAAVLFLDRIAVERSHATGTAAAALVNYLHARIALVSGGHALVPNAQSQRFVVCLLKLAAMCQGICSLFTSITALVQELVNL
ncbi:hypothetical protein NC651_016195 [Populus alba x Populus x berolinensis]|nr:hypothetical protein NC651_016195 [Populus alba x Populus x berolinensis]